MRFIDFLWCAFLGLLAVLAAPAPAEDSPVKIEVPTVVQTCGTYEISFGGGFWPYTFSVYPADSPGDAFSQEIEHWSVEETINAYNWTVTVAAGYWVWIKIVDDIGREAHSDTIEIIRGLDESCVNLPKNETSAQTNLVLRKRFFVGR